MTKNTPPATNAKITIQGVVAFKERGINSTLITARIIPVAACKAKLRFFLLI